MIRSVNTLAVVLVAVDSMLLLVDASPSGDRFGSEFETTLLRDGISAQRPFAEFRDAHGPQR